MKQVMFSGYNCNVHFGVYSNGRIAIELRNAEPIEEQGYTIPPNSERIATATVNVVDLERLADDEVLIKDYSENEGMFNALKDAGIISDPLSLEKTGFVAVPRCKLLVDPSEYNHR